MTRQESVYTVILRTLEIICATFFAFLGSGSIVLTAKSVLYLIGELLWRLPKGEGYLHWDAVLARGLFIISTTMFSASFVIVANNFWDGRWSRRTVLYAASLAIAGFCAFIVSMAMLGAGLSQID